MGLYKRGQVWWMRFTYQGAEVRRSTETSDKKLAQRIYEKVRGEIATGKWFDRMPGEGKTFGEVMERYLREHSAPNKTPLSYRRDQSLSLHLLGSFQHRLITEITPKHIAAYKTRRRAAGAAPKTVNNELILMGHAFNLAMKEWEWVNDNPVAKVSKEKVQNLVERWLTLEEEERLMRAAPPWLQRVIHFALQTGLRQGELLNLKWSHVDLFRRTLTILEQKNKAVDTLPLNELVVEVLKTQAKVRHLQSDYVFPNGRGKRTDARNLIRAFARACAVAHVLDFRFHDLRHTFATRLVQAGVDLYAVQKLGRWKTISMVARYAHHYPESLRPGVEALARASVRTKFAHSRDKEGAGHAEVTERIGAPGRN